MNKIKNIPLWGTYTLLAYMPLHLFIAQSFSAITGNIELWKAGKDVFTILLVALTFVLVLKYKVYKGTNYLLLGGLSIGYLLLHLLLYKVYQDTTFGVAALATVYNNRLFWFLGIGMGAALLLGKSMRLNPIIKVVLMVSTAVSIFGILQYFLPKDFLTHFGYSLERGARPMFFIDDKPDLPRIMSTLRDPNSLGAYLMIPITLLTYYWFKLPKVRTLVTGLLMLHGLALLLTFSRSAWLGTMVSVALLLLFLYGKSTWIFVKRYAPVGVVVLAVFVAGAFLLRGHYFVQNVLVHSDESTTQTDSNNLHWQLVRDGTAGVLELPQGHGPGTAGIVSIQNEDGGVLTENYYVQIAYEVGMIGLAIFVTVTVLVYRGLYGRTDALSLVLLATFWGYVITNNLLHTWSNESVAAQWWLLAGLVLGTTTSVNTKTQRLRTQSKASELDQVGQTLTKSSNT